jgi:ribosomal protein S18 acetylase RimI-like enzyme
VLEIRVFNGAPINDHLVERIIDFDRQCMETTIDQAGLAFPEENRRKGFQSNPTLIVAFAGDEIAGYIEYLRSWNDPHYIYISSLQIQKAFRGTTLLLALIDRFRESVSSEDFLGFETNVQKVNKRAVQMYRKAGFQLTENPRNEASWIAKAGPELLTQSPIILIIEKWRSRSKR